MATATRRRRPADESCDPSAPVPIEELTLIESWRPNVMVAGPAAATLAAIDALRSGFRAPVCEWRPGQPLDQLPIRTAGTLIVNDASALSGEDQRVLQSCLQGEERRLQVVSTTSVRMLPFVEAGEFDAALYYALNVIYLELSEQRLPGFVGPAYD